MKEGLYLNKKNDQIKVISVDEPNNMVYAEFPDGERCWVGKVDYQHWLAMPIYIPDIPAQMIEPTIKSEENAIQEFSTSSLLQHSQETATEAGGERGGVESGNEGQEISEESQTKDKQKRQYTKKQK